ncbi:MAG: TetR family transcriptional regulator [Nocardioides sp.]|jgi:AcrR family transcriptional regulator|nr:TetR family transcriptional regulator [Nocardioides sp.]
MNSHGYHGTSIRDIAVEAGVSSAALYHHFDTKQAILVAVMRRALDDSAAATEEAAAAAGPRPDRRLAAVVRAWVTFHAERQADALISASEIRSLEAAPRAEIIELRDRQEWFFRSIIEAGVSDGTFAVSRADHATRAIITMGTSVATWFDANARDTPDEVAREYADLALTMVGARTD